MTSPGLGTSGPEPRWSRFPNPTRRPLLRTVLTVGVLASVFLICLLVLLGVLEEGFTGRTIVLSALTAVVPLLVVVPTYLWLDRFEAEPPGYLLFAFLWGALVAVAAAFFLNTAGLRLLTLAQLADPLATGAVYLAPVTEETFKGLGVLLVYVLRRREFDGVVDGIVYAGLVGAGFAFSENIVYLGSAFTAYGTEGLAATFVLRGVLGPFAHPLFTSLTGIGIGVAATARRPGVRALALLAGWVAAMVLHAGWNLTALAGIDGFVQAYVSFQVPVFVAFLAFLVWLRRREGRLIGTHLSPYAAAGWLSHSEVAMLSRMRTRRQARAWARAHGGAAAKRSMSAFQDSASELALLRARIVRGTAEAGAAQREAVLLQAITAHRRSFVGSPVT